MKEENETSGIKGSAFDPENYGPVSLIMMMRLYDIGLGLLSVFDENRADQLSAMHAQGLHYCPPPAYIEYETQDEDEETQVPAE